MTSNLVTIVALSVDTRHAVLYLVDGQTMNIPQGDPRLPRIVEASRIPLGEGMPALIDLTPVVVHRTEFSDAEKGTNGVVTFFKVAKSFLKKLVNTESPVAVPEEVAHISPLSIGVFPGTKEKDEAPQEALPDLSTDEKALAASDQARAEGMADAAEVAKLVVEAEKKARIEANATTSQAQPALTNDQKLDAAKARMQQLVGNSHGTEKAEFHAPLKDDETIVAVHATTGAIIPDAHKLARHLRQSQKLQSYVGFQAFIERLSAVVEQRGHSAEDLMKFIEHGDLPIADDGCIVIYKKLNRSNGNFVDVHTGRIPQQVGDYVYLLPHLIDPSRRNSCSNGLHVGVMSYVRSFSGNVTIMAKLRPEDVYAVPEYEHTKMRVAGYHIVAELSPKLRALVDQGVSISQDPEGAVLLNAVLRGEHVGIRRHVQVGGHQGQNVTITETGIGPEAAPATLGYAQALDMQESLEVEVPAAADIKATDLVQPQAEPADEEESSEENAIIGIMSTDPKVNSGEEAEKPVKKAVKAKPKAKSKLKKAAAKSAPKTGTDPQAKALTLLAQGLSNIEVARQTGLSKDQVYRLKKKLAA